MKKLIKKILKEHVIITEEVAPEEVHRAADKVGMEWDDNEEFMDFSEEVTGERHIDDMSSLLRKKLIKKILKEQEVGYIDQYSTSYNDFGDKIFLKHILKELDRSIIIEDVVKAVGIENDWVAWLEEAPFEDYLRYGYRGIYHYSNTGDLNRVVDHEDNDAVVSAISIMLEDIFGGDDWMSYYYVIHKYLQEKISKYMKDNNYPNKHTLEW